MTPETRKLIIDIIKQMKGLITLFQEFLAKSK